MSSWLKLIRTCHRVLILLVILISAGIFLSPYLAGGDTGALSESSTASSSGSYIFEILVVVCAVGALFGLKGLLNKKEKEKWFYIALIIVSILCCYFLYVEFYTWRL